MLAFFHGITPYKSTPGNAIHAKDFTRSVPDNIDRPELDRQRIDEWTKERARLVEAITASHAHLRDPLLRRWNATVLSCRSTRTRSRRPGGRRRLHGRLRVPDIDRSDTGNPTQWWTGQDSQCRGVRCRSRLGVSLVRNGRIVAGTGNPEMGIASQPATTMADGITSPSVENATRAEALYIDGEPVTDGIGSTDALDAPERIRIGSVLPDHLTFDGDIRNVNFWDRTLPHRTIIDLASIEPTAFGPGLTGTRASRGAPMVPRRPVIPHTTVLCVLEPDTTPPVTHVLTGAIRTCHWRPNPPFPSCSGRRARPASTPPMNPPVGDLF